MESKPSRTERIKPQDSKPDATERAAIATKLQRRGLTSERVTAIIGDGSKDRRQVADALRTWLRDRPKAGGKA